MYSDLTPLYHVWTSMRYRCRNPNSPNWAGYGGRGITVCSRWDSYGDFLEWAKFAGYEPGLELDRINNDEGYSPENCRFVDRMTNQNNRRNTKFYEYKGMNYSVRELYNILQPCVGIRTFQDRLRHGWNIEDAAVKSKRPNKRSK